MKSFRFGDPLYQIKTWASNLGKKLILLTGAPVVFITFTSMRPREWNTHVIGFYGQTEILIELEVWREQNF